MLARIIFVLTAITLIFTAVFFWRSPWSPAVPHQARQKVVQGDIEGAISLLRWRADNALNATTHIDSLWEAAQLLALKTDKKEQAVSMLKRCIHTANFEHHAMAHAYIASLISESSPRDSIYHWKQAIKLNPNPEESGRWWVRVASTYEQLDESEEAISAWGEATQYEDVVNMANLALGRLLLKANPKQALEHFQAAQEDTSAERSRSAELGAQLARWEIKDQLFSEQQKKPVPRRRRRR